MAELKTTEKPKEEIMGFADRHTVVAVKQLKAGIDYRKGRLDTIRKIEDAYFNKLKPTLQQRMAVPLPIMEGFVDALWSKIDDPPRIQFSSKENMRAAKKLTAAHEKESADANGSWNLTDLGVKFLAILSGRGIYKLYAENKPYKQCLEPVDYNDFVVDPNGGGLLKNHLFKGQQRIFKTKSQLETGAKEGFYNAKQVEKLINAEEAAARPQDTNAEAEQDYNRKRQLGLDPVTNNYTGTRIWSMVEWVMVSPENGKQYYILFDSKSGIWVRFDLLKNVFPDNDSPWVSFATHYDPFNFWSKGPCDSMYAVHEAMNIVFNQALENRQRRNFSHRAYDPEVFPDPSKLRFKPDGLVRANRVPGKTIADSIYTFQVEDVQGSIDLIAFLDSFVGQKSGITPGVQGASERDKKVGIFFGELQQVEDRISLKNKFYKQAYAELGKKYEYNAWKFMDQDRAVQIIGTEGAEWDTITKDDHDPEFEIMVIGGQQETAEAVEKSKARLAIIGQIQSNPVFFSQTNKKWLQELLMSSGDVFSAEDIQTALDVDNYGSQENLSMASKAIQNILEGKNPKLYRGATTGFMQRILNYATDKELDMDIYKRLIAYALSHTELVLANMKRRAQMLSIRQKEAALLGPQQEGAPTNPGVKPPVPVAAAPNPAGSGY